MAPADLFEGEPEGTREAIMKATYEALLAHGYADLTIQRIGDEFPKSKSLLYHHYEGKDDLLLGFLEFMLDRFESDVPPDDYEDAAAHLRAVLDRTVPAPEDRERVEFTKAIVELRAQAAHDPAYRDHFTRSDRFFRGRLADIVREGVEEGTFAEVDPERVAALLLATINGAMLQRSTADDAAALESARAELDEYVRRRLRE